MSLSVMAEKLYSRFIVCFSNVSFLLLGFTIFGKFTTRAEFKSITRSGNKTVDETRDPNWMTLCQSSNQELIIGRVRSLIKRSDQTLTKLSWNGQSF